jgi:hypothetical protein
MMRRKLLSQIPADPASMDQAVSEKMREQSLADKPVLLWVVFRNAAS